MLKTSRHNACTFVVIVPLVYINHHFAGVVLNLAFITGVQVFLLSILLQHTPYENYLFRRIHSLCY